jgi:hypothetical protein
MNTAGDDVIQQPDEAGDIERVAVEQRRDQRRMMPASICSMSKPPSGKCQM